MKAVKVFIRKSPGAFDLNLPEYQTVGSSAVDLYAAVSADVLVKPRERKLIPTGISIAMPEGYEAQVRPRSGLALKHHIGILNSPGTIDSDYRGIVGVILFNFGKKPFTVNRGDRIAQMVFNKIERAEFEVVDEIDKTKRGDGGFGHTGV